MAVNPLTESLNARLAETFSALESMTADMARARAELSEATRVARSSDRAVEATVGPQGQLLDVRFLDGRYRSMSSTELAASVLEAVSQARDAMARQVVSTMAPFTEPLPGMEGVEGMDIDWAELFGPGVVESGESGMRKGSARLRDEIDEDGEE
ncbi:YbaB/EbfC family nucleoid-associated protein [Streptomyces sp. E5N91]|uniref:YbaB/EbfC family nucleoid-associated protein n=1 Tax=Streptomyces sp. E5N91 TaxID=1851996 RepID=UPI001EE87AF7|nr:YbaB/EbfC family nucleoid-associated protein [Streptomyces sp. E5N91]